MRAIKIDSKNKTVSEIDVSDNSTERLRQMQAVVGGCIEPAHDLDNCDTVYVNEEGLFGAEAFFEIEGGHQPFAGDGIVLGFLPYTGDSTSAKSSVSEIRAKVKFLSLEEVRRQLKLI